MATPTKYTYSISADFGGQVNTAKMTEEILAHPSITVSLDYIGSSGDSIDIWFHDVLDEDSKEALDGNLVQAIKSPPAPISVLGLHDSSPSAPLQQVELNELKTPEGILEIVPRKSFELPSVTLVSVDFGNERTWWYQSQRHTDIVIEPEPDNITYELPDNNIVNVYEVTDGLTPTHLYNPDDYKVIVKKDGVDISQYQKEFEAGMPDVQHADRYKVDYVNGEITFANDQSAHEICVSYSEPKKGVYRVEAPPGKRLRLTHIELQFSAAHDPWPNPMEFVGGVNSIYTGNMDYDADVKTYRGMRDIINFANLGTAVPASAEFTREMYQIPFNWIAGYTIIPMGEHPTANNTMNYMELRLKYDKPLTNTEIATASFYMFIEDHT